MQWPEWLLAASLHALSAFAELVCSRETRSDYSRLSALDSWADSRGVTMSRLRSHFPRRSALESYFFSLALSIVVTRNLEPLLDHARKHGIRLGLENVPYGFLQTPTEIIDQIKQYNDPHLGLTIDAANLHFHGARIREELAAAQDFILITHISDTTTKKFTHAHLGQGDMNLQEFGKTLF